MMYLTSQEVQFLEEAGDFIEELREFILNLPSQKDLIDFEMPVVEPVRETL